MHLRIDLVQEMKDGSSALEEPAPSTLMAHMCFSPTEIRVNQFNDI